MQAAVLALAILVVAAQPAGAQGPTPTIHLIDENMCWQDVECGNWLWGYLRLAPTENAANPLIVRYCTSPSSNTSDAPSCIRDLASRARQPAYRVCLWGNAEGFPGGLTNCPPLNAEEFQQNYPDLSPLEWCGSAGCRPPSLRATLFLPASR